MEKCDDGLCGHLGRLVSWLPPLSPEVQSATMCRETIMTSPSDQPKKLPSLEKRDLGDFAFARARDLAFDAVVELWLKRSASGMTQLDVCRILGRHPSWVSRNLRGPSNWTLRTFGELVEALNGELTIAVSPREECADRANYHAYIPYDNQLRALLSTKTANAQPGASKNYGLQQTPIRSEAKSANVNFFGLDAS